MNKKIIAPGMVGKRHTDETRAQMSAAHKERWARFWAENPDFKPGTDDEARRARRRERRLKRKQAMAQ
jgi:hypothetical protein